MKKKNLDRILIGLLLINLILYLPSLFEPISYGDECIYLTLGNAFRKGLVFYRDIHDNKPPFLYLIAALSNGRLFYFRLITIIWNLLHLTIIYQLIKKITKTRLASLVGGLVFTIGLLLFEGRIANGEVFMMMPVTAAVYLLFSRPKRKTFSFGLAIGSLFASGFLFKVPVFFDLLGIIFALYLLSIASTRIKKIIEAFIEPRFFGIVAGFSLPILITIIYYSIKGAFVPYVRSALLQNIGYLSSWQGSSSGLFVRGIILLGFSALIFLLRKRLPYQTLFFASWFIFALFGALLSGRPYPHYLIEIVPALSVLTALTIDQKRRLNSLVLIPCLGLLTLAHYYFHFWHYPILSYYRNFTAYLLGKISSEQYLAYWGKRTIKNYQLARFIQETSFPDDRVFVWGDAACVYAISRRLPPGRYTVNYHIFDFNGFQETLAAIKKTNPPIIIKMDNETKVWPELNSLLGEKYYPLFRKDLSDQIYLRINQKKW